MASTHRMEGDMAAAGMLYKMLYAPGQHKITNRPIKYDNRGRRMLYTALNAMVPGSSYSDPKYRFGDGSVEAAISGGIEAGLIGEKSGNIFLTKDGAAAAEKLWNVELDGPRKRMNSIKDLYESFTHKEALVFFYCDYPERADGAGERQEFDRNRLDCAVSMAQGNQVSIARSSEVAGMCLQDFENEMIKRGIKPYVHDYDIGELEKRIKLLP